VCHEPIGTVKSDKVTELLGATGFSAREHSSVRRARGWGKISNSCSRKKRIEKLNYMHMNPVKRGLVADAKLWAWSSYRFYQMGRRV
jgi:hypothetical protein